MRRRSRLSSTSPGAAASRNDPSRTSLAHGLAADAEAVLHGTTRAEDAALEVGLHLLIFRALRTERLPNRVVALMALVRQERSTIEWRQRK